MFSDGLVALAVACGLLGVSSTACAQSLSADELDRGSQIERSENGLSAATHSLIDRADIQSMPQLVDSLIDAITRLSSFRKPSGLPPVTRVSRAEIERTICDGPCMVKAWYLPDGGVFFDDTLTPETNLIHRSILLHELVHFVQEFNGEAAGLDPCHRWVQREQQAYEVQARYLALIGDESGFMQKVSAQSALVASRTVCRGFNRPADAAERPRQAFSAARPAVRE